jgi:hypothetical protein
VEPGAVEPNVIYPFEFTLIAVYAVPLKLKEKGSVTLVTLSSQPVPNRLVPEIAVYTPEDWANV